MTPTTCTHRHIKTWVFEDTHEPAMWSCADCGLKFAPQMATLEEGRAQGLREAREAVKRRYMGDNNREDAEVLRCAAAIEQLEGK